MKVATRPVFAAFWVAVVDLVYRAPSFAVNSIVELGLRCFSSVDCVGSGRLRDVLPAKSSARSLTRSLQLIGTRSVVANSNRG